MKVKILFFHGLAGYGPKAIDVFCKTRPAGPHEVQGFVPYLKLEDAAATHQQIAKIVEAEMETEGPLILSGHGIGAFWAKLYSQRKGLKCFVFNPVWEPHIIAPVADQITDWMTNKTLVFTQESIKYYQDLEAQIIKDGSDAKDVIIIQSNDVYHDEWENKYPCHSCGSGLIIPQEVLQQTLHTLVEAIENAP